MLVTVRSRAAGRARLVVRFGSIELRRTVAVRAGAERRVRVPLTKAARRALRRRAPTAATVTAAVPGAAAVSWRTRLLR